MSTVAVIIAIVALVISVVALTVALRRTRPTPRHRSSVDLRRRR